jgi:hypothetical protein
MFFTTSQLRLWWGVRAPPPQNKNITGFLFLSK